LQVIAITAAVCARVRALRQAGEAGGPCDAVGGARWVPCCDLHEWAEDLHTALETLQQVIGERLDTPERGPVGSDWYI
jgi:hypothetical protein